MVRKLSSREFSGGPVVWKIKNLEDGRGMFLDCEIFNQDLGNWNVEKLVNGENMFSKCSTFEGKGLEKWNPVKLDNMNNMFGGCKKLCVDIHDWKLENLNMGYVEETFDGCYNMHDWQKPLKWR